MIYCLTGKILEKTVSEIVLDVGGVGYQIFAPSTTIGSVASVGHTCTVYTYLNVKEDGIELYGFADTKTQSCFKMLISVSGVGPKVGLGILSYMTPEGVMLAISAGDFKEFTKCPGIGPKLAQRLVLELKDKVGKLGFTTVDATAISGVYNAPQGTQQQAVQALVALGYSQTEAAQAVSAQPSDLTVSEIIRLALKAIATKK